MSIIVRNGRNVQKKKKSKNGNGFDFAKDVAIPVTKWAGERLFSTAKGLVSAYMSSGGSKQEMVQAVAPLARSITQTSKAPKFQNVSGGVKLQHVEAIPLTSTSNALVISSDTFTWLSTISSGFEEYKIKMEFGYVPICPATTTGSVMLAFDYDPSDNGVYLDYQDFFNTADHCIGAVWTPCAISPKESKWLKTGQDGDPRLWSPGVLKVNTTDYSLGYYMVRYTVELRMAQPPQTNHVTYTGTRTTTTDLLGSPVYNGGSQRLVTISGTVITQQYPGRMLIVWSTSGNTGAVTQSTSSVLMGSEGNSTRSMITYYSNSIGNTITLTSCATAPGTPQPWRLTAHRISETPLVV